MPPKRTWERVACPWCTILTRRIVRLTGCTYCTCRQCGGRFTVTLGPALKKVERWQPPETVTL